MAGIAPPEQQTIFTLIAALLHLGNMAYYFADDTDTAALNEYGSLRAHNTRSLTMMMMIVISISFLPSLRVTAGRGWGESCWNISERSYSRHK